MSPARGVRGGVCAWVCCAVPAPARQAALMPPVLLPAAESSWAGVVGGKGGTSRTVSASRYYCLSNAVLFLHTLTENRAEVGNSGSSRPLD